jgi:hypothetical protein
MGCATVREIIGNGDEFFDWCYNQESSWSCYKKGENERAKSSIITAVECFKPAAFS